MSALEPAEVYDGEVVAAPQPVLRGRFALYVTDRERLVFALRVEGEEEDRHFQVPAPLLKLLSRQLGGDVLEMLRRLKEEAG